MSEWANWWMQPSTWAPQRGPRVWTRQMDWAALALLDDGMFDRVDEVADEIGVDPTALMRRIDRLIDAAGGRI